MGSAQIATSASGETPRVLVVDDYRDTAEVLVELLFNLGYDVRVARDGQEALATAAEFSPHVALLDTSLPGMDGYEVARRIRRDASLCAMRLIALTGFGENRDPRTAGFDDVVGKPVELSKVRELVSAS